MQTNAKVKQQYPRCILYIDDDVTITSVLEKIFEHLGYEFYISTMPSEALRMVQEHPDRHDLVVTDLNLPEMNGLDLAKEISKINPVLPILLCTGSNGLGAEELIEAGISAVLQKPFSMRDLEDTMHGVLDTVEK